MQNRNDDGEISFDDYEFEVCACSGGEGDCDGRDHGHSHDTHLKSQRIPMLLKRRGMRRQRR
jgi:hypothetical protein